jgi:Ca-activated chloride channel family protein
MDFKQPLYLLLYIPFILFVGVYWLGKFNRKEFSVPLSSVSLSSKKRGFKAFTYPYLPLLRFAAIALLIFTLAQPGNRIAYSKVENYGVDIMIVQDISISMLGLDFQPQNRLEVSKTLMQEFITKRKTDRIGIVLFAGEAYLQSPLTTDYSILTELIEQIEFDDILDEGTAIGNAIALAAARLTESDADSKIILLITDGASNSGVVDPETAAVMAKELGIKVYAIGIGTDGRYRIVVPRGPNRGEYTGDGSYNEDFLIQIADETDGKFYRAKDEASFAEYIQEIDRLEKSKYEVKQYHEFDGQWQNFIILAFLLYVFELLLRSLIYRKVP